MGDLRGGVVIALKDLRQRSRDGSVYITGVAAPVALALLLELTLGGAASGDLNLDLGVHREATGRFADQVADQLLSLDEEGFGSVEEVPALEAGLSAVDSGDLDAMFVIPEGFDDEVVSARTVNLTVVGRPTQPIATQVARSIGESALAEVESVRLSVATGISLGGGAGPPVGELAAAALDTAPPVTVELDPVAAEGFDFGSYFAVGLSVFFLFFTVQLGVVAIVEERTNGTLQRLVAAPIGAPAVLGGKLAGSFVLGVVTLAALVLATTLVMDAQWGALGPVAVLGLLGVSSALAVTALVATFSRTVEQAGGLGTIVGATLGILGGSFFPIEQGGAVLEILSRASPHRWLVEGYRTLGHGGSLGDITSSLVGLTTITVVLGTVSVMRAPRTLMPR